MSFNYIDGKGKIKIIVIGIGGAGRNAVSNMLEANIQGVEFIIVDTNKLGFRRSNVPLTLQIGEKLTNGLGTGSNPDVGRAAAEESIEELKKKIPECHMFFLTAGFGGGTGTGATPVIAQICKERSDLVVGVISKPFSFEGRKKREVAQLGIKTLQKTSDAIVTIPNDQMRDLASKQTKLSDIFKKADEVLHHSVKAIIDLLSINGYVNLDFADIKSILKNAGSFIIGSGKSSGPERALKAVDQAILHPFLENTNLSGAHKALVNITGSNNITFEETAVITEKITNNVGEDTEIFWGQTINENLDETIQVTLIVTGIWSLLEKSIMQCNSYGAYRITDF